MGDTSRRVLLQVPKIWENAQERIIRALQLLWDDIGTLEALRAKWILFGLRISVRADDHGNFQSNSEHPT